MIFKKSKNSHGFSLTELLVVVAIIGLLLTLAATIFIKQIAKGNDSRRKADLNRIKIAVEEYEKDKNCYPDLSDMQNCGSDAGIAVHPYLNNVPCDPQTKTAYAYETDGLGCPKSFRMYAKLENENDSTFLPNIGPDEAYSYYISSENAPQLYQTNTCPPKIGCINNQCQKIAVNYVDGDCVPVCSPYYDGCYGQCEGPNAASPCVAN